MDRWKLWAVAGWSLLGVALLAGAGGGGAVRARRLAVEDDRGRERIVLEVYPDGPVILMNDGDGVTRYEAWVTADGSFARLGAGNNGHRATVRVARKAPPEVELTDGRATRTVTVP